METTSEMLRRLADEIEAGCVEEIPKEAEKHLVRCTPTDGDPLWNADPRKVREVADELDAMDA